jgi:hypothetical protein
MYNANKFLKTGERARFQTPCVSSTPQTVENVHHNIGVIVIYLVYVKSRDSSVSIVTDCTARVRYPAVQDFSLLHGVQTGSGAHPASYPMGIWGFSPGVKAAGA